LSPITRDVGDPWRRFPAVSDLAIFVTQTLLPVFRLHLLLRVSAVSFGFPDLTDHPMT
jgi:hypothetical protein